MPNITGAAPNTKPTATVRNKFRERRFRKADRKISAMIPAAVGAPTKIMIQPKNPILPIKVRWVRSAATTWKIWTS